MRKLFALAARIWSGRRNLHPALSGILIGTMCGAAVSATLLWAEETGGNPLWLIPAMFVTFIAGAFLFWSGRIYDGRQESAQFFMWLFVGFGVGWVIPSTLIVPAVDADVTMILVGMNTGVGILLYCAIMASVWWRKYRRAHIMPTLLTLK